MKVPMKFTCFFLVLFLLASCRSSSQMSKTQTVMDKYGVEKVVAQDAGIFAKKVTANAQTLPTLTARIKMDINAAGQDVSVGGSLRMKRDDVVQLSLTFLGMEVARMEFSPEEVLLIDRFNKQYVRATYADVSFLRQAGLDFYALQALFWNELFVPGQKGAALGENFQAAEAGKQTILTLSAAPQLAYTFFCSTMLARIDGLEVKSKKSSKNGKFEWIYSDFETVSGKAFPTKMSCKVTGLGRDIGFNISLSKIGHSTDWNPHTQVSKKYTRRKADELLGKLLLGS